MFYTDGIKTSAGLVENEQLRTPREGQKLLAGSFELASKLDIQSSPTFLVNNRETFNAQDAAEIATTFCKSNPGLPACGKQLSAAAPAQAPPAAI